MEGGEEKDGTINKNESKAWSITKGKEMRNAQKVMR